MKYSVAERPFWSKSEIIGDSVNIVKVVILNFFDG